MSLVSTEVITDHPFNNVTENIFAKIGANLHRRPDHPICIIKEAIYSFFDERHPGVFSKLDGMHPVVTAYAVRLLAPSYSRVHVYCLATAGHALPLNSLTGFYSVTQLLDVAM